MRWPWTRRESDGAVPAVPAVPAPAATPAPAQPSPMGWAFLPPIQRSLDTPIDVVTRPAAFPAGLPAWRSPAFTGSLGHAVSDVVPGGVVDADGGGIGTPTYSSGRSPELTLLPPPRPTAVQRAAAAADPPLAAPLLEPAADETPAADAPAADVVRPEPPAPTLLRAAPGGLPVVQRVAVTEPARVEPAPPLAEDPVSPPDLPVRAPLGERQPRVPQDARPAPAVQRTSAAPTPATAVAPAVSRPRLGLGAPLDAAPVTAVPTPVEPAQNPRSDDVAPTTTLVDPDAGFTEVPIQRAAIALPLTPAPSAARPGEASEPAASPGAATEAVTPTDAVEAAPGPPAGEEPDAAGSLDLSGPAEPPESREPSTPTVAVEPPPVSLPSVPLPLVSGISTSIQRAAVLPGPGLPTPSLVVRPAPLIPTPPSGRDRVVPIQRLSAGPPPPVAPTPAGPPSAAPPSAEPARLRVAETPSRLIPRRADSAMASGAPAVLGRIGAAMQRTAVQRTTTERRTDEHQAVERTALQRATGPALPPPARELPPEPGGPGLDGSVEHRPAPAADESPVTVQPLPVRIDPAPLAPASIPSAGPTVVSRAVAAPTPATTTAMPLAVPPVPPAPPEPVAVQTAATGDAGSPAAQSDPATSAAQPPVPVQAAAAGPAPAGAAPAAGGSATGDVDALAQKLFPAVLRRMKAELLLDRERRGVRTDPW